MSIFTTTYFTIRFLLHLYSLLTLIPLIVGSSDIGDHVGKTKENNLYHSNYIDQLPEIPAVENDTYLGAENNSLSQPTDEEIISSIPYKNLLGTYVNADKLYYKDTITIQHLEKYGVVNLHRKFEGATYGFITIDEERIRDIGSYSPWRIQIAKIKILSADSINVMYNTSFNFDKAISTIYVKTGK